MASAIFSECDSLSTTQGPAIRKRLRPPTSTSRILNDLELLIASAHSTRVSTGSGSERRPGSPDAAPLPRALLLRFSPARAATVGDVAVDELVRHSVDHNSSR